VKFLALFVFISISIFAQDILVSTKTIKYKEILNYDNLLVINSDKRVRCQMFDKEKLLKQKYQAKRYILKGRPICNKDVQIAKSYKIRYDFGNIVIERAGKIIGENKQFIKIQNPDGTIEKIYKNGQVK